MDNCVARIELNGHSSFQDVTRAYQSLFVVQLKIPDNAEYTDYMNRIKNLSASKYHHVYSSDKAGLLVTVGIFYS